MTKQITKYRIELVRRIKYPVVKFSCEIYGREKTLEIYDEICRLSGEMYKVDLYEVGEDRQLGHNDL